MSLPQNVKLNFITKKIPTLTPTIYTELMDLATRKEFTSEFMVTPKVAADILQNYNSINRNINDVAVQTLARDMINGNWKGHVGDEITIDWDGHLNNGQHRLSAIVNSNTIQRMSFRFGIDPASKLVEGNGRGKFFADSLAMTEGKDLPYKNSRAALCRLFFGYLKNQYTPQAVTNNYKPSNSELHDIYINYGDELYESLKFVMEHSMTKITVDTNAALVHFLLKNSTHGTQKADEFMKGIATGVNLSSNDPRMIVRNRFILNKGVLKKKNDGTQILTSWRHQGAKDIGMGLMVKGWNAWVNGKTWSSNVESPQEMIKIDGLEKLDNIELYKN